MSFRPGPGPIGTRNVPPKGYVAGLGRGAAGFTTRSDIGPLSTPSGETSITEGSGSRAAEMRAAKLQMKNLQQQQTQNADNLLLPNPFGVAPQGYVAGSGRGAGFKKENDNDDEGGPTGFDSFGGYDENLFGATPYDDDDEEADKIYNAIDERMNASKKRKTLDGFNPSSGNGNESTFKIGDQFRDLKEKLSEVTEEEWAAIPAVADYSLRHKQKRREDLFTPITDSLLEARAKVNADPSSGATAIIGTAQIVDGMTSTVPGYKSVISNMSGLAGARGTVLGMSLDRMADSVSGQTVIDPKGYLTSLSSVKLATSAEIGDIKKARLLLKSVRDTNPKHGPAWIASARVEEAANNILAARKLIQDGCEACPLSDDVWIEAARLHPIEQAKTILASAVRRIPTSVKIFMQAADLESHEDTKKIILRKGLESNPTSVALWKATIELENADDAKILLSIAVEKVPHSIEMWLALARLETYENAKKVLNQARRAVPAEKAIWIAAAKLEESQNHFDMVDIIIGKAITTLQKHDAVVTRDQWLKEAEVCEKSGAPRTSVAIIKQTIGLGVEIEDSQRTWADDASGALSRGSVETARAILAHSLTAFPTKSALWMQAVDLEKKHGNASTLDNILAAASDRLPQQEYFWLLRAKEQWLGGNTDKSREILTNAFVANPNSETIWLAAVKLEWENNEIERARVLLQRAREHSPSGRVFMKSALLERESADYDRSLELIEEGITLYPIAKLFMMGCQICSEDLSRTRDSLERARKYCQRGLDKFPDCFVLWILASRLEENAPSYLGMDGSTEIAAGVTKARSLMDLSRLKNPKNENLWLESIRLERRAGNDRMVATLLARALQDCPLSGILLAENILFSTKAEQKSKSADAIKKCPDDPHVINAVAWLFAIDRKEDKARKWFERAVSLNPDLGDSWARYLAFELVYGTSELQQSVLTRCATAEPKHGEVWCSIMKATSNRRKSISEGLRLVANHFKEGLG